MAIDNERNRVLTSSRDRSEGTNSFMLGERLGLVRRSWNAIFSTVPTTGWRRGDGFGTVLGKW